MSFAHVELVWCAALAPLVLAALFAYDHAMRRRLQSRLGELPVLGRVMATASLRRRVVKLVLVQLALSLVLLAAARPQVVGKRTVELRGLDVVVALDVSKSMVVDDVGQTLEMIDKRIPATRLARARELATTLVEELPGDRIGPVVFAGAAAHLPLTEDHAVAVMFLSDLGPADLPPGSNLGEVFRVSRCMLRPDLYDDLGCARLGRRGRGGDPLPGESLDPKDAPAADEVVEQKIERGKAMVVITDGGDVDEVALREVVTARELGIAVFVVGVGSQAGGLVREIDHLGRPTPRIKRDRDGKEVRSKRDDAGMQLLAQAAGDERRYFIAAERGEVDPQPIVEALRAVTRGLAIRRVEEKKDVFQPFLFAALMLLVIDAAIATRRRRRYPEEH
jgi:Ca-activated chloride channel homolog